MGNANVITTSDIQQSSSDVVNQLQSTCGITTGEYTDNITIDLSDTYLTGGINFDQSVTMGVGGDPSCCVNTIAQQNMLTTFQNNQSASEQAGVVLGLALDITDSTTVTQMQDQITTRVQNKCKVSTEQDMQNITVLANDYTVIEGGISFDQTTDTGGACVISTLAQLELVQQGKTTQSSTVVAGFTLTEIIIFLVACAVVGIILIVILHYANQPSTPPRRRMPPPNYQPPPYSYQPPQQPYSYQPQPPPNAYQSRFSNA